jgi:hypothetical protein
MVKAIVEPDRTDSRRGDTIAPADVQKKGVQ